MISQLGKLHRSWTSAVTSVVRGQWLMLDTGFQATQTILATETPTAGKAIDTERDAAGGLYALALSRASKGLAPPREIYLAPFRDQIDWAKFPDWARPSNPDMFEGCAHEG
jgi:hypothetical protein